MKSTAEWQEWGRRDPLHGVATWPGRERGGANPWTDDAFYALGEAEWADFRPIWWRYGVERGHVVEFGCGAGRLTRCLAREFDWVTAVDVSPEQIVRAQRALTAGTVAFAAIDGVRLPLPAATATAFFSTYVFQHFASLADARAVLAEAARVLAPGGGLFLQLPLYRLPATRARAWLRRLHVCERRLAGWRVDWRRWRGQLVMRMLWYEREWLERELAALGFGQREFRSVTMTTNGGDNDLVLARKT
jgi:ubiquinone/menaquinone biosynthesis C-methylase UbiE